VPEGAQGSGMLTIWGRPNSINVQKVLWLCGEIGLRYALVEAGGAFGGTGSSEYRRLNPNGLVPTIDDDGYVLWESNVILRYLATKHAAGTLYPQDLAARFEIEKWMDWHATTLWPALRPVFVGLIRTPPHQRDEPATAAAQTLTERAFSLLDQHLCGRAYVAGQHFTIADIPLGIATYRWSRLPVGRPALPDLARWQARLEERRAYRDYVALPLS
jgi:glutathione S-transferase